MTAEGIITIVITLILGIPSIITIFRISQTKIVYLEKQIINLKDDLLKNFDQLSIKYKGIEIQQNIYFVSGFLVCQGNKDISNEKNYVEIYIPENSKWLDINIVSNSKGMKIQKQIVDNKAQINFDLFKNKEYIEYEAIIEIDSESKKRSSNSILEFHHRIPNVPSIQKFNIETLKSSLSLLLMCCIMMFLPLFIVYDYNKIDSFDIEAYDADTNKFIDHYTVLTNKTLDDLKEKVIEKNSGIFLFLNGKTANFPVETTDIYGIENTKLNSVYFKMKKWQTTDWIFFIFLFLVFIVSLIGIITSIALYYYQKRYLKLIKK